MKELEFLAVGDIHIEAHSRYVEDYMYPVVRVLKQIVEYAKNKGIDTIIQLGDIFDNPNPKDTTQIEFLKCLDKDINWYIIVGNHEYYFQQEDTLDEQNAYELIKYFNEDLNALPNVHIYMKPKYEKIEGIPFKFLPFPHTNYKPEKQGIRIGHFSVSGYRMDNGREIKEGEKISNIKNMILGHLHTKQLPLYPGSILQANFGETPNKGFLHCTAKLKNKELSLSSTWVPLVLPLELHTIDIDKPEDITKLDKYKDSKYKLKLLVKNDVALPKDLTIKYPNVVKVQGYKSQLQKEALQRELLIQDETDTKIFDEYAVLKKVLKSSGLKKLEWKEGLKIIKEIREIKSISD